MRVEHALLLMVVVLGKVWAKGGPITTSMVNQCQERM